MSETPLIAVAVVGVAAILPDAPTATKFWENVKTGQYSISDVDPARWDPELYFDPDPRAPDKSYTKIGGWVREWEWDPASWRLPLPPRVADEMDNVQKWALSCARAALLDYGWPQRPIDTERTAVIVGNAMGGEKQARTSLRVSFPEFIRELDQSRRFKSLPVEAQDAIIAEAQDAMRSHYPVITEDTMPGELANIVAGRVANVLNLRGPNFVCDAACASALAAVSAGVEGLVNGQFDAVLAGGAD
ncbi:MAG TPA: beta-ketoacyl synthase N-terminal-like domain-containing protein, partial [Candidatus Dormibacteraeota bacterium]|nr:beta-ketoacyl synthase N-terminal-like domain-containing protein [Candidatus Dormibacteraeota bacterium]